MLHVVVGELAPKTVAIQKAEAVTIAFSKPIILFYKIMYPFIWFLNGSARVLVGIFGIKLASEHQVAHSEEELRILLSESYKSGEINKDELKYMNNIFEFDEAASRALSTIDNHVRQAIFNLRSEPEIDDSLNSRITKWLSEWSSITGTEVEAEIQIPNGSFTVKDEIQVFAIIQEAFANIRKHAKASQAVIKIEGTEDRWQLKIADNGSGISGSEKSGKKYGMSIMQERAKQLGATLQVMNRQNGGTEIIVTKENR